jgi:hypothetical protein
LTVVLKASVWAGCGHRASIAETRSKKLASGDILKNESFKSSAATLWLGVNEVTLATAASIIFFRSSSLRGVGSGRLGSRSSKSPSG